MKALYTSKLAAYAIQIVSTIILIYAYFQQIPAEYTPLKQALALETIVQIIQVAVYTLLLVQFSLSKMAMTRYLDWIITTPLLLLAFMIYLNYQGNISENKPVDTFKKFIKENRNDILFVILANGLMLLSGFLGELGYISKQSATITGFIALLTVFWIINKYASKSKIGSIVFVPFAFVWSMYGIVYNFSDVNKNVVYNILDTIAKNVFGLFLSYNIFSIA